MAANGKNNKINGTPEEDLLAGLDGADKVDGISGDDDVAGGEGSDWVKGGSGDDVLQYTLSDNGESGAEGGDLYDGGSGNDSLLINFTFDQWMRWDVQEDVERYLAWLPLQLNRRGVATGEGMFQFNAFDLQARKIEDFRVTVDGMELTPEDDPVLPENDHYTGTEDDPTISGNVLLNDTVADLVRAVTLVDTGRGGTPEIHTDGSFTLTLDNSLFQYLAVGETEDLSFTYQVEDADGDTETAQITVTVTGVNDAPIARELNSDTLEEDSVRVQAVYADTDIDATDEVDVTAVTQDAQGGLFTFDNDHIDFDPQDDFVYLAAGESTTVTTTYTITDEHGASDTHTWSVLINGVNGAPVAVNDSTTISEDEDLSGFDLLANDWDPDASDVISLVSLAQPSKGESVLESSSAGTVGFNTGTDFDYLNVGDSITLTMDYDITDDSEAVVKGTDTGQFSITITGVNDGPEANMDIAAVSESGSVNIDVLDNDTDVDQNSTLSVVSAKVVYGGGTASVSGNQVVFNTNGDFENLALGQTGEAIVEYVMEDEHGAQSTSAAFVQINGEQDDAYMVNSLNSFGGMTAVKATEWHKARYAETGNATVLDFSGAVSASGFNSQFAMGFNNQPLFGLGNEGGLREEADTATVSINPPKTDLLDIEAKVLGTGGEFNAWANANFSMSFTPFVEATGGYVNVNHAIDTGILGTYTSGGYTRLNTSSGANNGNQITLDMPDAYTAGIDSNLTAKLTMGASASGEFLGEEIASWSASGTLIDINEDFTLLSLGIKTTDGGALELNMFDNPIQVNKIALPKGIGTVEFYDETDEIIEATSSSGDTSETDVAAPVTGIRFDIDDILGLLPKVGKVFAALDDTYKKGIPGLGGFELGYTLLGAGLSFDIGMGADSSTKGEFTVDLLFDRPVNVEGIDGEVIALRNADWNNLPGIKSVDGSAVNVMPLFNSQLGYSSDLSLNLSSDFDYKVGELSARAYINDLFDKSFNVGPLLSGDVDLFEVDLVTLGTINYGTTGYDQFQGGTFTLA